MRFGISIDYNALGRSMGIEIDVAEIMFSWREFWEESLVVLEDNISESVAAAEYVVALRELGSERFEDIVERALILLDSLGGRLVSLPYIGDEHAWDIMFELSAVYNKAFVVRGLSFSEHEKVSAKYMGRRFLLSSDVVLDDRDDLETVLAPSIPYLTLLKVRPGKKGWTPSVFKLINLLLKHGFDGSVLYVFTGGWNPLDLARISKEYVASRGGWV